jgi:hypothetical protein
MKYPLATIICLYQMAQDAALVAEAERIPFFSAKDLKAATGFLGQKKTRLFQDLRQQVSGHGILRWSFSLMNINYTALHLLRAM